MKKDLTSKTDGGIEAFVEKVRGLGPVRPGAGRGRLMFAMDATASREPSWDRAARVQGEMFLEADRLGGLDVQLVYYRGFDECRASRWVSRAMDLVTLMTRVGCRAGQTQLRRILRHAIAESEKEPVRALVFIGDCVEEDIDELGAIAGQLGLRGVRAFLFQEGSDANATRAFRDIAKLTGGAHCRFDSASPEELRALLGAVAAFAAGGMKGLAQVAGPSHRAAKLLTAQIRA